MSGFSAYISDSYQELKGNVSWTSWSESQRLTLVVIVFSVVFSLLIWGVDLLFSNVIEQYFNLVKS